jgi:uncharacterized protein (TIGR00730 family)
MSKISSVAVFCGSKAGDDPDDAKEAQRLGEILVERNIRLVYGGGGIGLMGVIARTVIDGGGKVTGVIPDFLMKLEVGNPDVDELITTESMHERKRTMFERADGFVILPGGLGTLDETFEIMTWKQLRQHDKPIVVVNVNGYWDPFRALIENSIKGGFAHPAILELVTVVDSTDQVMEALENAPEPQEVVLTSHL